MCNTFKNQPFRIIGAKFFLDLIDVWTSVQVIPINLERWNLISRWADAQSVPFRGCKSGLNFSPSNHSIISPKKLVFFDVFGILLTYSGYPNWAGMLIKKIPRECLWTVFTFYTQIISLHSPKNVFFFLQISHKYRSLYRFL